MSIEVVYTVAVVWGNAWNPFQIRQPVENTIVIEVWTPVRDITNLTYDLAHLRWKLFTRYIEIKIFFWTFLI